LGFRRTVPRQTLTTQSKMEKDAQKAIRRYRKLTMVLAAIGFGLAYYSVYVSATKSKNPEYQALCDISESMRCSKVFTSPFGKGLGLVGKIVGEESPLYQSNGVYGMVMYTTFAILSLLPYVFFARIQVLLGVIANATSAYLAYILFFVIGDICVVCISTYTIGFLLFVVALLNLSAVKNQRAAGSTKSYPTGLDGRTGRSTPGKKRV